ncbi:MAG: hypothetical protein LBM87_00255 [Ruminococcus sp.]|jgi:hypothetical protein|nr:hypothetical protein [Ruminococcus sp.]
MVILKRQNTENDTFTATEPKEDGVYRAVPSNEKKVLTLSELENPVFGQWYDEIESEILTYSAKSGCFHIRAYLLDKNEEVTVTVNIGDKHGLLYHGIHKLDGSRGVNFTDNFQADCEIDCATLTLVVTAVYSSSGSRQSVSRRVTAVKGVSLQTNEADAPPAHPAPDAVSITVDHPTKRGATENVRLWGKDYYRAPGNYEFPPDADAVTIALGRSPGKTDDIDYLVKYGYRDSPTSDIGEQTGGKARIVIPGGGTIDIGDGNEIDDSGFEADCLLYQSSGGACKYTSTSEGNVGFIRFKTDSPNSNKLTYYMPSDNAPTELSDNDGVWKNSDGDELFDKWGTPTAFEYVLNMTIPYVNKTTQTSSKKLICITSRKDTPRLVGVTYQYIKPLKIAYGCILEGTLVLTKEGLCPIETVQIGDKVYSPETDSYVDVINTWSGYERSDLTEISAGGVSVTVTADHPIFTPAGYVAAKLLKTGDTVLSGQSIPLSVTTKIVPGYDAKIYNLDTEGNRGYAAGGGDGLWVGTNQIQNELIAKGGRE